MSAFPSRGEICFAPLPTDPQKVRPVVIVSSQGRNQSARAATVLVMPLTTNPQESPTRIQLAPGETGLREACALAADNITMLRKTDLSPARTPLRTLSEARLRDAARGVLRAMGFPEGSVS